MSWNDILLAASFILIHTANVKRVFIHFHLNERKFIFIHIHDRHYEWSWAGIFFTNRSQEEKMASINTLVDDVDIAFYLNLY